MELSRLYSFGGSGVNSSTDYHCFAYVCNDCIYVNYYDELHVPQITAAVEATCEETGLTEGSVCSVCERVLSGQQAVPALGHDWALTETVEPTCAEDGYSVYTCSFCQETEVETDENSALGHDYKAVVTQPTCTKGGDTTYTCARCDESYIAKKTAKRKHWFGEWTPNGNDTHSADCRRKDCDHTGTAACADLSYTVNGIGITLCPVCGQISTGELLTMIDGAEVWGDSLPHGELVLRRGALADGTRLLSAGIEYSGKLQQPGSLVKITLPAAEIAGYTLLLTDKSEIAVTVKDDLASFDLDFTKADDAEATSALLVVLLPAAA